MAIVIKEIKVVTVVEKGRNPHTELTPELLKDIREICQREKHRVQPTEQKRER